MDERDRLHVAAAAYAHKRRELARQMPNQPVYTKMEEQYVWLAHYEGFRAGIEYVKTEPPEHKEVE